MSHKIDFLTASSEAIIDSLCRSLDEIRLSRNISQAELAKEAGVSRRTITRLADGKPISLDSFVRVLSALKLSDNLATLLPDPKIRPVERAALKGRERQRASSKNVENSTWKWGDTD